LSFTIVESKELPDDVAVIIVPPSPQEEAEIRRLTMAGAAPLTAKFQVMAKARKVGLLKLADWRSKPAGGAP